ncbi:MAG TPA: hypothetical protein VKB49_22715 [Candidatus Sulfotelmatobacter sp.]|nr:hypothetical protein [Candidatus Sulfotelmatobacter sp.]
MCKTKYLFFFVLFTGVTLAVAQSAPDVDWPNYGIDPGVKRVGPTCYQRCSWLAKNPHITHCPYAFSESDSVMGIYKNFTKGPVLQTTIQLLSCIATHIALEGDRMIRVEKISLLLFSVTMFGCGSMSSPKTATGTWQAVMTSTTAQAGQQGEQAVLLVNLQQNGKTLNATVSNVLQESGCFPTGSLRGTTLNGQVILPGGEAMSNLQLSGSLNPSGGGAIMLSMTGAMQPDANSSAGTFTLNPNLSGCANGTGTFEMTRMHML